VIISAKRGLKMVPANQEHKIRKMAYWLYLLNGRKHGNDLEDWLRAERFVVKFEDLMLRLFKVLAVFLLIWLIIIIAAFFILPYFGYQVSVQKVM
jgi:hypothetical protein